MLIFLTIYKLKQDLKKIESSNQREVKDTIAILKLSCLRKTKDNIKENETPQKSDQSLQNKNT